MNSKQPEQKFTLKDRMHINFRSVCLIILIASLAGCSILPKPPATGYQYFTLQTAICDNGRAGQQPMTVASVSALPGVDSKKILFAKNKNKRGFYQYASWLNSPSGMLQQLLAAKMDCVQAGRGFASEHPLLLTTQLFSFQHTIVDKPGTVDITIKNQLLDKKTNEVIKTKVFTISEPVVTYNSEGAVDAFQRAVNTYLESVAEWISVNN